MFKKNDEGGLLPLNEITHLPHFSKTLSIIFKIQLVILLSETLIVSQTKSWVSQNIRKYRSEYEWTVLNDMTPANHIQAAASWLATAAQPPPGSAFLTQLRIPSLQNKKIPRRGEFSRSDQHFKVFKHGLQDGYLSLSPMLKVGISFKNSIVLAIDLCTPLYQGW